MKLKKIFKYALLAICLTANAMTMESKKDQTEVSSDVRSYIIRYVPYRDWPQLATTCKSWLQQVKTSHSSLVRFQDFKEININTRADLSDGISNFGCTPTSLCIFLPLQGNPPKEKITAWEKTAGFSINGYTGEVQSLQTFNGVINSCVIHPQGIIWEAPNQHPQLLTITATAINSQPVFEKIEEIKDLSLLCCSTSHVLFSSKANPLKKIFYTLNGEQRHTLTFTHHAHCFYSYGDKFLLTRDALNGLEVINPALENYVEKTIDLSPVLMGNLPMLDLAVDGDSAVIQNRPSSDQSTSYVMLNNISSEEPKISPAFYTGNWYQTFEFYLKNNYVFSIVSLDEKQSSKNSNNLGGLMIYDLLSQKTCFQRFFPNKPCKTYFVGHTIFINTIVNLGMNTKELLSFNVKHFLS